MKFATNEEYSLFEESAQKKEETQMKAEGISRQTTVENLKEKCEILDIPFESFE